MATKAKATAFHVQSKFLKHKSYCLWMPFHRHFSALLYGRYLKYWAFSQFICILVTVIFFWCKIWLLSTKNRKWVLLNVSQCLPNQPILYHSCLLEAFFFYHSIKIQQLPIWVTSQDTIHVEQQLTGMSSKNWHLFSHFNILNQNPKAKWSTCWCIQSKT